MTSRDESVCREPEGRSKAWVSVLVEKRRSAMVSKIFWDVRGACRTCVITNLDTGALRALAVSEDTKVDTFKRSDWDALDDGS
jgi:hypothetical protein